MTSSLFVYGTLRRGAGHPMFRLLAEHGRSVGPATFGGVLLDVGPYPAAVASDDARDLIHGEVHTLRPECVDRVLSTLDEYEGCAGGGDGSALYVRSLRDVVLADGRSLEAWVWLWKRSTAGLERIEHGDWLRHLDRA